MEKLKSNRHIDTIMRHAAVELNKFKITESRRNSIGSSQCSSKRNIEIDPKQSFKKHKRSITMNGALQAKLFGVAQLRTKKLKVVKKRNIQSPLEERKNTPLVDVKRNQIESKNKQAKISQIDNKTPDVITVYASKEYLKMNKVTLSY